MAGSNPFADLYVTESIGTEKFAELFSPVLANESQTHALFQPGNIFLTGLQGSGKTALLSLLRPEVMIAYRRVGPHWPLPEGLSRFVAAGINLNSSKARDFGQRMLSDEADPVATNALLFGDFLNYWIVDDLLHSIEVIRDDTVTQVYRTLGVHADQTKLDELAKALACHACWFGSLEGVSTYAELKRAIDGRIYSYRRFLNYNADLPSAIARSKTSPGEPIGVVAETLKQLGVIQEDVPVFVVVDQFEDLMGLEVESEEATGRPLREVVMKMLSERRQQVSYRIGARPYSLYPDFGDVSYRLVGRRDEELQDHRYWRDSRIKGGAARSVQRLLRGCFSAEAELHGAVEEPIDDGVRPERSAGAEGSPVCEEQSNECHSVAGRFGRRVPRRASEGGGAGTVFSKVGCGLGASAGGSQER